MAIANKIDSGCFHIFNTKKFAFYKNGAMQTLPRDLIVF
jgi:hypothetical protein